MNYAKLSFKFQNMLWKYRFTRKWSSIFYLRRQYGYSLRELMGMYRDSVAEFREGGYERRPVIAGLDMKDHDVTGMYRMCAERRMEDSERWACIYGCCTVLWHNNENIGGYGRAGCPCGDMEDPRDLGRGRLA